MTFSRIHAPVGWTMLFVFLATGAYMRHIFPEAYEADSAVRFLYRSNHVYILFSSLLNILRSDDVIRLSRYGSVHAPYFPRSIRGRFGGPVLVPLKPCLHSVFKPAEYPRVVFERRPPPLAQDLQPRIVVSVTLTRRASGGVHYRDIDPFSHPSPHTFRRIFIARRCPFARAIAAKCAEGLNLPIFRYIDGAMHEISEDIRRIMRNALAEDIGSGDATTISTIPDDLRTTGLFIAKQNGILAGLSVAALVFQELDARTQVSFRCDDGAKVEKGTELGSVTGLARVILTGERTALNILQRMSGIATLTRTYVDAVAGTGAVILD